MEKMITVEISLDGPRVLQCIRPSNWDTQTEGDREEFIHEMEQDLIGYTVAFTVKGDD